MLLLGKIDCRKEFFISAKLDEIYPVIKIWLQNNQFKIKEERENQYIKAQKGSYFGFTDKGTRRYLEVNLSKLPKGNFLSIYEKVGGGGVMIGQLLDEEVLSLENFIKSQLEK